MLGPGIHVAERSLAIAIMRLLWAFDISPVEGVKLPIDPNTYASNFPGNPGTNMPVKVALRDAERREIINHTFELECKQRPCMVRIYAIEVVEYFRTK